MSGCDKRELPRREEVRESASAQSVVATPPGFERVDVAGVAPTPQGHAVVLAAGHFALPIFVGETEGLSIELRLMGGHFHRPLTHDLVDAMLADLGAHIESVRIEREENRIFYSVVVLAHDGKKTELDARSSDAIALALGNGVPIFVARTILEHDGVRVDELEKKREAEEAEPRSPSDPSTVSL